MLQYTQKHESKFKNTVESNIRQSFLSEVFKK